MRDYHQGIIYATETGDAYTLYTIDPTGKTLDKIRTKGRVWHLQDVFSPDYSLVFVGGEISECMAINSGKTLWQHRFQAGGFTEDSKFFYGIQDSKMEKLDAVSGSPKTWESPERSVSTYQINVAAARCT